MISGKADYLWQVWVLSPLTAIIFLLIVFGPAIIMSRNNFSRQSVFEKALINLCLAVSLTAIIFCSGRTLLVFLPVIILTFYFIKKKPLAAPENFNQHKKIILPLLLSFLVIHFLNGLSLSNPFTGECRISSGDYDFYPRLAAFMKFNHTESIEFLATDPATAKLIPYHYGDIWMSVAGSLSGLHTSVSYRLFYQDVCAFFFLSGVLVFFPAFAKGKIKWLMPLLPFLLLGLSPLHKLYPDYIPFLKADDWENSFIRMPKLAIAYSFLLAIIFSLLQKDFWRAVFFSMLLAVIYLPLAPALFSGLALTLIFCCIRKMISLRTVISIIIFPVCLTICIGIFYHFFNEHVKSVPVASQENFFSFRTMINITGKTILQTVITSLPFIILAIMALRKKIKASAEKRFIIICFCVSAYLSGLLSWAALNISVDSVQLWGNIAIPVINICCIILVLKFFISHEMKMKLAASCVIVLWFFLKPSFSNFSLTYDFSNYQSAAELLKENPDKTPAIFIVNNITPTSGIFNCYPYLLSVPEFTLINPLTKYVLITTEPIKIPPGRYSSDCEKALTATDWYAYQQNANEKNYTEYILKFFKEKNGKFLLSSANDLPSIPAALNVRKEYFSVNGFWLLKAGEEE